MYYIFISADYISFCKHFYYNYNNEYINCSVYIIIDYNQGCSVFLIIVYKIIDKYINFNIISFKISININNNSIYYVYYINYTL